MLCIIAMHFILLYTLYTLRPHKVDNAHFIFPTQNEQITRITFITRPAKKLIGSKNPKITSASTPGTSSTRTRLRCFLRARKDAIEDDVHW